MIDDEPEAAKAVLAWITSESTDNVAAYAARGRKFSHLSDGDLSDAWIKAFKAEADDIHNKSLRNVQADYTAEFKLRGLEPPHGLVADHLKKMTDSIAKWLQGLTPEEEDELGIESRRTSMPFKQTGINKRTKRRRMTDSAAAD